MKGTRSITIKLLKVPSNDPKAIMLEVAVNGITVRTGVAGMETKDVSFTLSLEEYCRFLSFEARRQQMIDAYIAFHAKQQGPEISVERRHKLMQKAKELFPT